MRVLLSSIVLISVSGFLVANKCSEWVKAIVFVYQHDRINDVLDWVGTGAFVKDNLILTAAHLHPDGCHDMPANPSDVKTVKVKPTFSDNAYLTQMLIKAPDEADIMVLRVFGYRSKVWFKVGKAKSGERVTIIAGRKVQDNLQLVTINGFIVAANFPETWGVTEPTLRHMIAFVPLAWGGASGSPLINRKGEIVGVVVGRNRTGQALAEKVNPQWISSN